MAAARPLQPPDSAAPTSPAGPGSATVPLGNVHLQSPSRAAPRSSGCLRLRADFEPTSPPPDLRSPFPHRPRRRAACDIAPTLNSRRLTVTAKFLHSPPPRPRAAWLPTPPSSDPDLPAREPRVQKSAGSPAEDGSPPEAPRDGTASRPPLAAPGQRSADLTGSPRFGDPSEPSEPRQPRPRPELPSPSLATKTATGSPFGPNSDSPRALTAGRTPKPPHAASKKAPTADPPRSPLGRHRAPRDSVRDSEIPGLGRGRQLLPQRRWPRIQAVTVPEKVPVALGLRPPTWPPRGAPFGATGSPWEPFSRRPSRDRSQSAPGSRRDVRGTAVPPGARASPSGVAWRQFQSSLRRPLGTSIAPRWADLGRDSTTPQRWTFPTNVR